MRVYPVNASDRYIKAIDLLNLNYFIIINITAIRFEGRKTRNQKM